MRLHKNADNHLGESNFTWYNITGKISKTEQSFTLLHTNLLTLSVSADTKGPTSSLQTNPVPTYFFLKHNKSC